MKLRMKAKFRDTLYYLLRQILAECELCQPYMSPCDGIGHS